MIDAEGPFFRRDIARVVGLPDAASMDEVVERVRQIAGARKPESSSSAAPSHDTRKTPPTPLPWQIRNSGHHEYVFAGDRLVASTRYTLNGAAADCANARYIVHACNAYPDLLAALKESNKFWADLQRGLVQAAERNMTKVDVGDLLTAVRHVLAIENAAIGKTEAER